MTVEYVNVAMVNNDYRKIENNTQNREVVLYQDSTIWVALYFQNIIFLSHNFSTYTQNNYVHLPLLGLFMGFRHLWNQGISENSEHLAAVVGDFKACEQELTESI